MPGIQAENKKLDILRSLKRSFAVTSRHLRFSDEERIDREHEYESHEEAKSDISEFVDKYYNYQRLIRSQQFGRRCCTS